MQNTYKVIGLMSGTSLDGLDIAYCNFEYTNRWSFSIEKALTIDYDEQLKNKLKNSIHLSGLDLLVLHQEYGAWLGKQVKNFIDSNNLQVDFISSHGHTVFHQIDKKLTFQLGDGQFLANHAQQTTICDFRTLDVSLGGQGAPLVPIGDQLLFSEYDFCLNLGGIVNVSFEKEAERVAFDVAPINMLLNHIIAPTGKAYDDGGKLARSGKLGQTLFDVLNALEFYQLPFPKSLGYEWFVEKVLPIVDQSDVTIPDKLYTSVHHIANQIADSLLPHCNRESKLLATGGGAKNHFFIEVLQQYLGDKITVVVPKESIIDFKEAMVFAFMSVLKRRNEINCLQSVTGAKADTSSGRIFEPF